MDKWLPCVVCGLVRVRHTPFPVLEQYYWLYLIRIDGAFYFSEYGSLMFLCIYITCFIKVKKHALCSLQTNVFNICGVGNAIQFFW